MEDMFSQYDARHAVSSQHAPQQPPRPLPQMALAIREPSRVKQIALTLLMFCVLAGVSLLGWQALRENRKPVNEADLPVIRASAEPYKIKPENPGGMDIPDKGRMVFNTIATSAGGRQDVIDIGMAQLTPVPEQPATPQQVAEATGAVVEEQAESAESAEAEAAAEPAAGGATEPVDVVSAVPEAPITPEASVPVASVPVREIPEDAEAAAPAPQVAMHVPVPVKKPAIKVIRLAKGESKPAASEASAPASLAKPSASVEKTAFRVQLGSFSSEKSLELGWLSLQKKFPKELGKLHRSVEVADLGDKGTFYRLHAGILPDKAAAQSVCDKLKAQSQGCIIAK